MHTRIASVLAGLALLVLAACSSLPPPVGEIPESIANATTAADHQRIADYFAQKAASYEAEAAWHEKMARAYATRPKGDLPSMVNHCRSLQQQFTNAARDARALEQAHRQLAAGTAN